jgi:hypothetical protein
MMATNFEKFVLKVAQEAPHAVVLDWFRRLDLTMTAYLRTRAIHRRRSSPESFFVDDPLLGSSIAREVAALRGIRNDVAHTPIAIQTEEAIVFARQCLSLIGVVWKAQDAHAS